MDRLSLLENQSIFIIREAYAQWRNVAMLWSMGKDSTTLLWLMRKAFFGRIPFPVIHIDTSFKFKEIYEFREAQASAWNLDLLIAHNNEALEQGVRPALNKFACCNELKTNALKKIINERAFKALYLAIRRDEHGIRAKERVFSPRNTDFSWDYSHQPLELWGYHEPLAKEESHFRIHPLLGWCELDVWEYIKRERIPIVSLYFSKGGQRFRSIGCECCCQAVSSKANTIDKIIAELKTTHISERAGRAQDKEQMYNMEKLRSLGYM